MALTVSITPKELERQAAACFEGKPYSVFLVSDPTETLGNTNTVLEWEALELAEADGYARATGTIGTGSYNTSLGFYQLPAINAQFTGAGAGHTHDAVVITVDGADYPHSILRLSEPLVLQAGQSKSYLIRLLQDD